MKIWFSLLFLFVFSVHANSKPAVIFVLYDAGETKALLPVIETLEHNGVLSQALVMGTARKLVHQSVKDINRDCGVKAKVDEQWQRDTALSAQDIRRLKTCLKAPLIVVGMASRVQLQVAEEKSPSQVVLAYYDGLSPITNESLASRFLRTADQIFVPSPRVRESAIGLDPAAPVAVVGQPTLEEWAQVAKPNRAPTRGVLYAGGYGQNYQTAFREFMTAMKSLPDVPVVVAAHPKTEGDFEASVLKASPRPKTRLLLPTESIIEAARTAQVVVTYTSTVGVQAHFLGKPVVYFDEPKSTFMSEAIARGWAKQVFDRNNFLLVLKQMLATNPGSSQDAFAEAGIPRHSAELISKLIEQSLKAHPGIR